MLVTVSLDSKNIVMMMMVMTLTMTMTMTLTLTLTLMMTMAMMMKMIYGLGGKTEAANQSSDCRL